MVNRIPIALLALLALSLFWMTPSAAAQDEAASRSRTR